MVAVAGGTACYPIALRPGYRAPAGKRNRSHENDIHELNPRNNTRGFIFAVCRFFIRRPASLFKRRSIAFYFIKNAAFTCAAFIYKRKDFLFAGTFFLLHFPPQSQGFLGRGGFGMLAKYMRVAAVQFFIQINHYIFYRKFTFFLGYLRVH